MKESSQHTQVDSDSNHTRGVETGEEDQRAGMTGPLLPTRPCAAAAAAAPTNLITLRAVDASTTTDTPRASTDPTSVSPCFVLEGGGPQWRMLDGVRCFWVEVGQAFSFRFRNELGVPDVTSQDGAACLSRLSTPIHERQVADYQLRVSRAGAYALRYPRVGFDQERGGGASITVVVYAPFPPTSVRYPPALSDAMQRCI